MLACILTERDALIKILASKLFPDFLGSCSSSALLLYLNNGLFLSLPVAPTIVISPNVSDPITEGDTISLVCTATGRPYATIQWYRDGTEITNGSLTSIYNEQFEANGLLFTSSILEVCSVSPGDAGAYSCIASNLAGNDSIDFGIQVQAGMLEDRQTLIDHIN